jgi:multidrug efflux pump subunit AcrB
MRYGISMSDVTQAIAAHNVRTASGSLETPTGEKNVITLAQFESPTDVGDVIISSYDSGGVLRVKDVAEIYDDFREQSTQRRINGRPAIRFSITKSANADIIRTADAVNALILKEKESLPPNSIDFLVMRDDSKNIRDKFNIVKTNGTLGLTLVLLTLTAFLSFHTSIWVAMGIPISLMGVLIVLPLFNVELDSITMSAMVLVIGIIVDDAIVIAENIFQHRERGEAPLEAAVNGLHEVAMPVFTTIATTILAFIPMFYIKGMLGRFIYVIPLTVIAALTASMLESYFILPAHLLPGLHGGKRKQIGRRWFRPIRDAFERFLNTILPLRYVWLFTACLLLAGALFYGATNLRFVLFARRGGTIDTIRLTLELPSGTPAETTLARVVELEQIIATFPKTEIVAYESTIGSGGFRDTEGTQRATMTLYLPVSSELTRPVEEINQDVQAKTAHVEGLTTGRTWRGFHTGEAIEIQVKGGSNAARTQAVEDVMAFLSGIDGVSGLDRDDKVGNEEIFLRPNFALLSRYGLTISDISQSVRVLSDGQVATSTRYGDEDVDFRVVLQDGNQLTLNSFHQIKITNRQGVSINLDEVVDFELHAGLYAIYHEDGEPTTTVTGDVDEDIITPLEVMAIVEDQFTFQHMRAYPGVRLDIGGEAADSRQAQIDIGVSFGLAAVGIYFLLMLLFESLTQPFIVLITIPFGIVGVILAFILHGITQASFFAGIGLVGLAGVVVNDALVMVAHLN